MASRRGRFPPERRSEQIRADNQSDTASSQLLNQHGTCVRNAHHEQAITQFRPSRYGQHCRFCWPGRNTKKQMVQPRPSLFLTNAMIGVLRELRELAAKEQDAAKLGELVVEINCLLNVIEIQLAKVEGGGKPTSH
jgi:hypothetical protein